MVRSGNGWGLWGGRSRGQGVGVVGLRGDKGLECEFT